jgi:acetyl esterase/lipase
MGLRATAALLAAFLALGAVSATPPGSAVGARLMGWGDLLARPMPEGARRIAYGPGEGQFGDLWLPDGVGPHPVAIMIHGGCWQAKIANLTIMNWAADDLRRRGIAVWNIEYRGVDQAGGGWPGTFADAAAGADALRRLAGPNRLDLTRVVAFGHSAGGHLAAWLAARPRLPAQSPLASPDPLPISAVVSSGGLPDLKADKAASGAACGPEVIDRLTGAATAARPDVWADTSPAERLPLGVSQFIVNGAEDPVAPPWLGRAFARRVRAAGDPVRLTVLRATGHVELIAPGSRAWAREAAIVVGLLVGERGAGGPQTAATRHRR